MKEFKGKRSEHEQNKALAEDWPVSEKKLINSLVVGLYFREEGSSRSIIVLTVTF